MDEVQGFSHQRLLFDIIDRRNPGRLKDGLAIHEGGRCLALSSLVFSIVNNTLPPITLTLYELSKLSHDTDANDAA